MHSNVHYVYQKQGRFEILHSSESRKWTEYLKKTLMNFIWIYVIGLIAFYITMLSVSARGSYLTKHITISMVVMSIISLTCSCILTISMIHCGHICQKVIPSHADEEERFLTEKIVQDDKEVNEPILVDINQRNIERSFSSNPMPSFHEVAAIR